MILACPVVEGHDLTKNLIDTLQSVVGDPDGFTFVIVDNGSVKPYKAEDYTYSKFEVIVFRNETNLGYYYPLRQLHDMYGDDELIGLIHNDMVLYEPDWDIRMADFFRADHSLGLVGLCGSTQIDEKGGRGGGTMLYFRGADVQVGAQVIKGQDQSAGKRITGLEAACVLDSLFMMFRGSVIMSLERSEQDWEDITLAHFYDRIWPCRVIEAGYRVAVLGVECDHLGGMTCVANQRYWDDCVAWLNARGIPFENPETEMYLVAERRFLGEYRDEKKFLPCMVHPDYRMEYFWR